MQPGTHISHYEIISSIGKGGMGEVWKARDTNLGREVAIKTLPPEFVAGTEHLARFRREARAASALNHPNICVVHDLGEADGRPFIVMELLQGETLRERLERGPLSIEDALDLGAQLADGLDAAHSAGILHRDIKPANIFVTDRGTAKLLDFGLARAQDAASGDAPTTDVTAAGTVMGTIAYMSPEQARGEDLDARSDLFSLGVVLYEMLTGRPAFTGNTSAVIFERIFNAVLEPPTRLNPGVPRELDRVVHGLLEKSRERRTSSASDIRESFARIRHESRSRPAVSASEEKSIVVLPFVNLSADPDNEYFSDGLTDEIITDLSQIKKLRVISRGSSMQLKGQGQDVRAVASELNVRYVLEGSVRKAGNAVRVTAQLVDPESSRQLWAEKYSGKLEDIFEIQEQISRKIVDALKMRLSPEEDRKLAARPIDNLEAFECYQRARHEIYQFTPDGLDRARELIETAIELVGDNELLYASLGTVYWQYVNAAIKPDDGYIDRAEELARKVFALNPDSAPGHALMGMVRQNQGRPQDAVRSFKTALAIDPNDPYALGELGRVYMFVGVAAGERARKALAKALSVDPLSMVLHVSALSSEFLSGHPDRIKSEGLRLLVTSEFPILRYLAALALIYGERPQDALRVLRGLSEQVPTFAGQACRFLRLALEGQPDAARACFDADLLDRARNVEAWCYWVSECYAFIDETNLAVDWLERAFRKGFWNYPYVSTHSSIFRRLRGQPRFEKVLSDMKTAWEQFEP